MLLFKFPLLLFRVRFAVKILIIVEKHKNENSINWDIKVIIMITYAKLNDMLDLS
jgi:hypothetical protein